MYRSRRQGSSLHDEDRGNLRVLMVDWIQLSRCFDCREAAAHLWQITARRGTSLLMAECPSLTACYPSDHHMATTSMYAVLVKEVTQISAVDSKQLCGLGLHPASGTERLQDRLFFYQ